MAYGKKNIKYFTDQMNREVAISWPPERIVSIVPSQTELMFHLGLRDEVVGITKFCIHPEEIFRTRPRIGGTKKLDFDKIEALKPDLIIGNKEENEKSQIEKLEKRFPVWMSDISTLEDAFWMISSVGELVNRHLEADNLIKEIKAGFEKYRSQVKNEQSTRAAYFIWKKPYMVAGSDNIINHMMEHCGLVNVFGNNSGRYPEITAEELQAKKPDVILLSSEPYPFKEKHLEEFRELCPGSVPVLVDGEMFSWYGSRLLKSPAYFEELIASLEVGAD